MATSIRALTIFALFSGALSSLQVAWPHWAHHLMSGQSPFASGAPLLSPSGPHHEALLQRQEGKRKVIAQFLAQDLTLLEAAAAFRQLNNTPSSYPVLWSLLPGRCEGEKCCLQVLNWAECEWRGQGRISDADIDALLHRLREELADHIRRHGKVVLPAP